MHIQGSSESSCPSLDNSRGSTGEISRVMEHIRDEEYPVFGVKISVWPSNVRVMDWSRTQVGRRRRRAGIRMDTCPERE